MDHKRAKELEAEGWKLFEKEHWSEAAKVFRKLLDIDLANEGGLQGEIASLRKLRNFDQAQVLLEEALAQHPRSVGLLSERAWINVEQKKYSDAIEAFKTILCEHRTDPDKAPEVFSWIVGLLRLGQRFDEAEEMLAEALTLFPRHYSLLIDRGWLHFYQNHFVEAAIVFETVLKEYKGNTIALQGNIACLRMMGDFADAKFQAALAVKEIGRQPGILTEMAWLSYEQSDSDEASRLFEEVVTLTPKDPYAHINFAWSLVKHGDSGALARASQACRDALSLDRNLPEAMGCLGVVAFKQGHLNEAEAQFRRSVATGLPEAHYADLGALYVRMGRYDEAEQVLKKGLEIKPQDASLRLELGNLYLQTEKVKDAVREFRRAVAIDPKYNEPLRALAVALMEDGRMMEAEGVLRNAIRNLDELKRWRLHLTLCQLLAKQADETGDSELLGEALKEANLALGIAPRHTDTHFVCGIVRCKLEDYRGALSCFRRCQTLDQTRVDAEINAKRVRIFMRQERVRAQLVTRTILCIVILTQLALLWGWRLKYGVDDKHAIITSTMITVLVPICLGLVVVSMLLPSLTKFKLTGLEVELSQPKPKEALASGPKGQISFGTASLSTSGALAGLTGPRLPDIS